MHGTKENVLEATRAYLSVEADDRSMPTWRRERARFLSDSLGKLIETIERKDF